MLKFEITYYRGVSDEWKMFQLALCYKQVCSVYCMPYLLNMYLFCLTKDNTV